MHFASFVANFNPVDGGPIPAQMDSRTSLPLFVKTAIILLTLAVSYHCTFFAFSGVMVRPHFFCNTTPALLFS